MNTAAWYSRWTSWDFADHWSRVVEEQVPIADQIPEDYNMGMN